MYRLTSNVKDASWLVTPWPDGRLSLMPAGGWKDGETSGESKGYGPIPEDKTEEWLNDNLGRIARATGLVQMAADRSADLINSEDSVPKWKTEIYLVDNSFKQIGDNLPWPSTDLTLYDKDRVRIRIINDGHAAFDLTVLYVDTDHGITTLFPKPGISNRIKANDKPIIPIDIRGNTTGLENVVFIAVPAQGPDVNFAGLAQRAPERMKALARLPGAKSLAGLLSRRVYQSTDFGNGLAGAIGAPGAWELLDRGESARGATAGEVSDHTMSIIRWTVKGTRRPKDAPKK
jgi:hypothetical protein